MRIVSHHKTTGDAEYVAGMLEKRGIAMYVSGNYSEWTGSFFTGSSQATLWVILDRQYDDAVRLLADPNYIITERLSADEIDDIRSSIEINPSAPMLPFLVKLLLLVGLFAGAISILIRY